MRRAYISGIGGLIGSATAERLLADGWHVAGVDANYRGDWFPGGSVRWRIDELASKGVHVTRGDFRAHLDEVAGCDLVVHCASQPSHDYSWRDPLLDASINYLGTLQLLEVVRQYAPEALVVYLSTNKVYGDAVNALEYETRGKRMEPTAVRWSRGIDESFPLDASLHTPFGISKLAGDLAVQDYGRHYGMRTVSLRCGCLTGRSGSAVEAQGFLGYLAKCAATGMPYTIYGHKGLQVRDNLDSEDLADAIVLLADGGQPKRAVYNMGGGPVNSLSVLEAIEFLQIECGARFSIRADGPERAGDHKWWVSDTGWFRFDYGWEPRKNVWDTLREMVERWKVAA